MKYKWMIGIASAAIVGTCAVTALAAGQPAAAAPKEDAESIEATVVCAEKSPADDVTAGEEAQQITAFFADSPDSTEYTQTTFTVEDGKIVDENGNVIGETDGAPESFFVMMDDNGNPIQVTVTEEATESDGRTMYTITESAAD